jgi:hypothetical protein
VFYAWIKRRGMDEAIRADGLAYLSKLEQHCRDLEIGFYQSLVDWCAGPDSNPDPSASDMAHWAETELGLRSTRTVSDEEGKRLAIAANERWWNESADGSEWPTFSSEELGDFQAALGHIAGFVGAANWEVMQERSSTPIVVQSEGERPSESTPTQPDAATETSTNPAKPSAQYSGRNVKPASTLSLVPVPLDEANAAAQEYLGTTQGPTARGCVAYIKRTKHGSFSLGRLDRLSAWTDHMEKEKAKKERRRASKGKSIKGSGSLTDTILATIPDRKADDPSNYVHDDFEILQSLYLNDDKTTERARSEYHAMRREDKYPFLKLWEEQKADAERHKVLPD